jgi:hypothetical protein
VDGDTGGISIVLTNLPCTQDADCADQVCSTFGFCFPASEVEAGHVTWTVNGQPASASSCAGLSNLTLVFTEDPAEETGLPNLDTVWMYEGSDESAQLVGTAALTNGSATLDLMMP